MGPSPSSGAARARRPRTSLAHPPVSAHELDKENVTIHGTTADDNVRKSLKRGLRSQSLGPGGLEALGEGTGNRQKVQPLPRSILKPSISLSPPKPIPRHASRSGTSRSPQSPARLNNAQTSPGKAGKVTEDATIGGTKVLLRSEEEQQAIAREREREEAQRRREERRKSLANRRVSFAPEATLHTWNVVELPEDATSSSEATNSTRRASSGSNPTTSPFPQHESSTGSLSTIDSEDIQVAASPGNQEDAQRKRKRRSSVTIPGNFGRPHELSSSPVSSTGSDDTHQSFVTGENDVVDESDTDEDRDLETEETITTLDNDDEEDATGQSIGSANNDSMDIDSSGELDQALREATQRASLHRMGLNDSETRASAAVVASPADSPKRLVPTPVQSEEAADVQNDSEDEEMTMEVTQSFGGILPSPSATERSPSRRSQRRSLSSRQSSSTASTRNDFDGGEENMELTAAIGGIQPARNYGGQSKSLLDDDDNDEEMTMDFTAVVGGLVAAAKAVEPDKMSGQQTDLQQDDSDLLLDEDMDITVARGTILSPVTERTEPSDEGTMAMDFTAAFGAILPGSLHMSDKSQAKVLMEMEADHGQLTLTNHMGSDGDLHGSTRKLKQSSAEAAKASKIQVTPTKKEIGSSSTNKSTTPKSPVRQSTPRRKVATPTKQLTPNPERPTTPSKTPPAKNVSMRITSPKRLFKSPKDKKSQPRSPMQSAQSWKPPVTLTPKSRRESGLGADQAGLGSPRVASLLDRRSSIGDQAAAFTAKAPSASVVRFEDPRELTRQLEKERAAELKHESGRAALQHELDAPNPDENEHTGSLREMIDGLTPKKSKLNGRKSLAIGGAKGLLGKRPAELDEDEDDATPKRLKGMGSPVKSIFLPAPPSKSETTGRSDKAPQFKLSASTGEIHTPKAHSPPKQSASSPGTTGRFKDTKVFRSAEDPPASFNEQLEGKPADVDASQDDERIHLQDFLNMTSIRFMELTTTKRRLTTAPGKPSEHSGEDTVTMANVPDPNDDRSLPACVVAGASTIPMLELYQHSCRELKKYIAEGRSIVHEIEDDTFEENPPLFREYIEASPQVRSIMDNQFKNVKTHARLLSKEMWYEWRMKLLDGLMDGLVRIQSGLTTDDSILTQKEKILEGVLPQLLKDHDALEAEAATLQQHADELANCDEEELKTAREELAATEQKIGAALEQIEQLQSEVDEKVAETDRLSERKVDCLSEIAKAEKLLEEYRGWSSSEVNAEKRKVDAIQAKTGWTISSAHDRAVVLLYKSKIALYLTPSSFKSSQLPTRPNATISLSYAAEESTCSTTERFFLQLLRARLLSISQAETPIRDVLTLVETGWNFAASIMDQVKDMRASWLTEEMILSDETMQITSSILLRQYRTKIHASFEITIGGGVKDVIASTQAHAKAVYGEELKEEKMADVLSSEISGTQALKTAVETLEKKLNRFLAGKRKH